MWKKKTTLYKTSLKHLTGHLELETMLNMTFLKISWIDGDFKISPEKRKKKIDAITICASQGNMCKPDIQLLLLC